MGLFGGGTTTTSTTIDPSVANFRNRLQGQQQNLRFNQFGGQRVEGISDAERQGFATMGQGSGIAGQISGAGGLIDQGTGILQGLGGDLDLSQFVNPHEEQVIGGIRQDFADMGERGLNAVGASATEANAFGGSRQGVAQAELLRGLAREESNTVGNIRSQNFNASVQNAIAQRGQQAGIAGQMFGAGMGLDQRGEQVRRRTAESQLGLGGLERRLGQANKDFDFAEFMRQQNFGAEKLALGGQLLSQSPFGQTTTEKTSGGGLAGVIGSAISVGSNFLPGGVGAKFASSLFGGGGGGNSAPSASVHQGGFGQGFGGGTFQQRQAFSGVQN